MTVGYYTDNNISQSVMKAFKAGGLSINHINNFTPDIPPIFYGILRGAGTAMRLMQYLQRDYWYVDNGYFDAVYMDVHKKKNMVGKYRVVKNGMIEPMELEPKRLDAAGKNLRVLLLPPSPYTAFMYDTTPEDWNQIWQLKCIDLGYTFKVRTKDEQKPLNKQIKDFDVILAFNSMGIMEGIKADMPVYTTHGIIRNTYYFGSWLPYYDIERIHAFYGPKQFTIKEIQGLGVKCLI